MRLVPRRPLTRMNNTVLGLGLCLGTVARGNRDIGQGDTDVRFGCPTEFCPSYRSRNTNHRISLIRFGRLANRGQDLMNERVREYSVL
jgi:hypothetical protein